MDCMNVKMPPMHMDRLMAIRPLRYALVILAFTALSTVTLYGLYGKDPASTARVILGLVFVSFLPGYVLCWLVFPSDAEVNEAERAGLSFGLSVPLTLIAVLTANVILGVTLTAGNIIRVIGVLVLSLFILGVIKKKDRITC